ncbi:DnaJ C-terminal domain-containing protein [Streptomyces shenzhenensis]|uniref:caspase, EACC1-associated type n=1 Tax=Streptomyces shenzhenensis TaxID=943815 RepID=UPI0033D36A2D
MSVAGGEGRRDALLIATDTYDDTSLRSLRSPSQDCTALAAVLADPYIGGFRTEQLKDARAHQAMRAVEQFFRDRSRDDLLLLHISCHGIKDDDGSLYFAALDTDRDLPASTAIPAAFLRDRMNGCRARTIVVLLDCCYSGAFVPGAKGDDQVHVRDELGGHGRVVLTATSRTEYAWEGERLRTRVPQPSLFTGALIKGLATGAADLNGDGRITVTELYDFVYESLYRSGVRQRPRMWADVEYQVTIARVATSRPPFAGHTTQSGPAGDSAAGSRDGGQPQPEPTVPARRGEDVVLTLELDLAETVRGAKKDVDVDAAIVCPTCTGVGTAGGPTAQRCQECGGRGETRVSLRGFVRPRTDVRPCPRCAGLGTVPPQPCSACAGEGRVRARRALTVEVPAGSTDGTRLTFAGQGEAGAGGGPSGDLYVEIKERPDPRFVRDGDDLRARLDITRAEAALGGAFPLDTPLDGRSTVLISPGVRDGHTLRLRNRGMPRAQGDGRGDLLVRVGIRAEAAR